MKSDSKKLVYLVMLFATFIWGINMPIMKIGLFYLSPMPYNAARLLCALVVIVAALLFAGNYRPVARQDVKPILLVSVAGFFVSQVFFVIGLQKTTAGNASLIMALLPVSVALINKFFKIEDISRSALIGIAVSLVGAVLIVVGSSKAISFEDAYLWGAVLVLISQVCYGYYTVFSRELLEKYSTYQVTAYIVVISTVLFCLTAWPSIVETNWWKLPLAAWVSIVFSGVFALCICNFLWIWCVGQAGSIKASIFGNLSPAFAIVAGYLLLGETFNLIQSFGAAVIFLGLYAGRKK